MTFGFAGTLSGTSPFWLRPGCGTTSPSEVLQMFGRTLNLTKMVCRIRVLPESGTTVTVTVRRGPHGLITGHGDTTLTCTFTSTSNTAITVTSSESFTTNDELSVRVDSAAKLAADLVVSLCE